MFFNIPNDSIGYFLTAYICGMEKREGTMNMENKIQIDVDFLVLKGENILYENDLIIVPETMFVYQDGKLFPLNNKIEVNVCKQQG